MTEDEATAAHLRDPATSAGLLPQWVRDELAEMLEGNQRSGERLNRLLTDGRDLSLDLSHNDGGVS